MVHPQSEQANAAGLDGGATRELGMGEHDFSSFLAAQRRRPITWGFRPQVSVSNHSLPSREAAQVKSIEQILSIIFDSIGIEKLAVLFFKGNDAMMFFLIIHLSK